MFTKILIANRGEIAVRVARTCRDLGIGVVAVYADPDARARHVGLADEAVRLPGTDAAATYLNLDAIIEAARTTGAEAIHPGYGFLSERADAAEAVIGAGIAWVGPPPEALRASGDKIGARGLASSVGVTPVPGTLEPVRGVEDVRAFAEVFGYPVAIKAAGGGGGRGLKVADSDGDVQAAMESAMREAEAYFGYDAVYLERYLPAPKHIEVQVLAPRPGEGMWLGARDCSLQRRHQKLVEETPPPRFAVLVPEMGDAAVAVTNACEYRNAGTVEFLVDEDGRFFFLEINARLQVEHTITEEVLGVDLVAAQVRISAGEDLGFGQGDIRPRGHAIECRINAEDPARGFLPAPGRLGRYREPGGPGIRVDSGFGEGDEVPQAFDSLIAKLVAWGKDREEARRRMLRALDEFEIDGIPTTIPAHRLLMRDPGFVDGTYSTATVTSELLESLQPSGSAKEATGDRAVLLVDGTSARLWHPSIASSVSAAIRSDGAGDPGSVVAPMHGTILKVLVSKGNTVHAGQPVAVLEAMKMETSLTSPAAGIVEEVPVETGSVVEAGEVVVRIV